MKKSDTIIRSTRISLKECNSEKLYNLYTVMIEYKRVLSEFIDILWGLSEAPTLLPSVVTSQVDTWLSSRLIQCVGKQASGIVRGVKAKNKKRQWMIDKLKSDGEKTKAKKLQKILNDSTISKPKLDHIPMELDARFVKLDLKSETSFDGWITLGSLGDKIIIELPFKRHKHFNKMFCSGRIKPCARVDEKEITLMFEMVKPQKKTGKTVGIDIGQKATVSCSDNTQITTDSHGHSYQSICQSLSRKKKGSKSFSRTQRQRTNFINWSVNQLDWSNIKTIQMENIKHLRKGRRTSASLRHWNYAELVDRLEQVSTINGVHIVKLNPAFTSQRCSVCGWVKSENRNGDSFVCSSCGYTANADLNASVNISMELETLVGSNSYLSEQSKIGFYWNLIVQENIVPVTQNPKVLS